jgi:hypothetical protein
LSLLPIQGPEDAQNGYFITLLKFRAADAILPGFQRQSSALHDFEADPAEKFCNICKRKNGVEFVLPGFSGQSFDELWLPTPWVLACS